MFSNISRNPRNGIRSKLRNLNLYKFSYIFVRECRVLKFDRCAYTISAASDTYHGDEEVHIII